MTNKPGGFAQPKLAEQAFYSAFEFTDLALMMAVWDAQEDIVCIHPMGERLSGTAAISASFKSLFNNGSKLHFEAQAAQELIAGNIAMRTVYEKIVVIGANEQPNQPVLATNIFRLGDNGWRMILHHGSPAPPLEQGAPPGSLH